MASILDLAVVALAVMVCGTLGLLAWTLGIAVPDAVRRTRRDLLRWRLRLAVADRTVAHRVAERQPDTTDPNAREGDR